MIPRLGGRRVRASVREAEARKAIRAMGPERLPMHLEMVPEARHEDASDLADEVHPQAHARFTEPTHLAPMVDVIERIRRGEEVDAGSPCRRDMKRRRP